MDLERVKGVEVLEESRILIVGEVVVVVSVFKEVQVVVEGVVI